MSRSKLSLVIIGAIAAAGIVFAGANLLNASSSDDGASGSCSSSAQAKAASSTASGSCAKMASCSVSSSCTKTAGASSGCPSMTASAGDHKACPASAAAGDHKACPTTSSGECAKPCGPKAAKTASIETIGEREGARVVLVGHYACGYCDLGVSDACQPGFQTKDGKNYLLSRNNLSKELKATARDTDVEIVTRVKKLDGAKYLEVEVVRHAS